MYYIMLSWKLIKRACLLKNNIILITVSNSSVKIYQIYYYYSNHFLNKKEFINLENHLYCVANIRDMLKSNLIFVKIQILATPFFIYEVCDQSKSVT